MSHPPPLYLVSESIEMQVLKGLWGIYQVRSKVVIATQNISVCVGLCLLTKGMAFQMRSGLIIQEVDSFPHFAPGFPWPRLNQLLNSTFPFALIVGFSFFKIIHVYNSLHGEGLTSDEELQVLLSSGFLSAYLAPPICQQPSSLILPSLSYHICLKLELLLCIELGIKRIWIKI